MYIIITTGTNETIHFKLKYKNGIVYIKISDPK